jgi:hypothetical protein
MKRCGTYKIRYESTVQILGQRIFLGSYQYRREAIAAEEVALTIRRALDRSQIVKRAKEQSQQISFSNNEQAA